MRSHTQRPGEPADPFYEVESAEPAFDWWEYFHAVRERLWVVILCAVLGLAGAGFYLRNKETQFRAKSVLFLGGEADQVMGKRIEAVVDMPTGGLEMLNTVATTINSFPFALRVAERLQLNKNKDFLEATGLEAEDGGDVSATACADKLASGMMAASYVRNTLLIDVVATTPSADLSILLANTYAEEFIRMNLERSTETTRSAGQFLVEEAQRLGTRMRLAEEAVQSFRERERSASFETMLEEAQDRVTKLSTEVSEMIEQIKKITADMETAKTHTGDTEVLLRLPSVAEDQQVLAQSELVTNQENELAILKQRYRVDHPLYVEAVKRQALARQKLDGLLQTVFGRLESQRALLQQRVSILESSRAEADDRLLKVTGKSIEYNRLSRELEAEGALHASVLNRLKEVDLSQGFTQEPVRIHDRAVAPELVPVPLARSLALGLVGGVGLGIALALALHTIDPTIRNVDQAERWSGLKVITSIPNLRVRNPGLIVAEHRNGIVAERFRTLRTSIAMSGGSDQNRVFLMASALPGEGKSFTSSNFAATLAQQGFKTLLVDMDLRKPSISKFFFGENVRPGLTELLSGQCSLDEVVRDTEVDLLSVISAGGRAENASELLSSPSVSDFLASVRERYDRVVLDTAPLIAVSDTLLLAELCDVACLVARGGWTPRKAVQRAIRLLTELDRTPVGLILNRLNQTGSSYYYSGYHHQAYGHEANADQGS